MDITPHHQPLRSEIEELITGRFNPFDVNRILGAFDMAEKAREYDLDFNDKPSIIRITRICKIILYEMELFDADIVIAALLLDVRHIDPDIDPNIIKFNFGTFTAFLLECLSKRKFFLSALSPEPQIDNKTVAEAILIISLAEILDGLRNPDNFTPMEPFRMVAAFNEQFLPAAESISSMQLDYLLKEIKLERSRILD